MNAMKRIVLVAVFSLLALAPGARAADFDCWMPPFGASLKSLDAGREFVKTAQGGGVSYYMYTGPCDLRLSLYRNPELAYGFVDGKLYCRLLTFRVPDDFGDVTMQSLLEDSRVSLESMKKKSGSKPGVTTKEYRDGEWTVLQLVNNPEKRVVKIKFNEKTGVVKSGVYHIPLREKLRNK